MPHLPCVLPHALHLVIEPGRFERAAADYPDAARPTYKTLHSDLNTLMSNGVPTFLHPGRDGEMTITFCTPRYEIVCAPTHRGAGYYAYRLAPLSLRSHDLIARRALRVRPLRWELHVGVSEMAYADAHSGFETLIAAWDTVTATKSAPSPFATADLTPDQARFLNHVETLIDLACEVESAQAAAQCATPVVSVTQMRTKSKHATRNRYRLQLASITNLSVGDYIHAGTGTPGTTGVRYPGIITVLMPPAKNVQIRFYRPVVWEQAQHIAWLMPAVSTKQYRIQKDAVRALREGQSHNPAVLPAIVEGWFGDYSPPATVATAAGLNLAQRDMIGRAHSVPDILLALGPPGTGKTHTIRALVRQQTAQKYKVLITSKNNKAVDNVLEALTDVDALRIGREEAVAANVRPLMIDRRARDLQAQILRKTQPQWAALVALNSAWADVQQCLTHLLGAQAAGAQAAGAQAALAQAEFQVIQGHAALRAWRQASYADIVPALQRQTRRFHAARAHAYQAVAAADALCVPLNRQARRCQLPWRRAEHLVAWERLHAQWQGHVQQRQQAIADMEAAARNVAQIWAAYQHTATRSPQALTYKRAILAAEEQLHAEQGRIRVTLNTVQSALAPWSQAPRWIDADPPTVADVQAWQAQLTAWHTTAVSAQDLLADWRQRLETRPQILYPTLIQMADVVGATCIGIATDARFEDLTFDLMIADEAGQIQVMDLLVPLVRARRAVLVGDDRQLPPLVEEDIRARLGHEDAALLPWLEQSLFERLFRRATTPDSRKVYLSTQYRMPPVIADFIGRQFYAERYHTGVSLPHMDPFFSSPLVLVDTRHERKRRERPARAAGGIRGYTNTLEAQVIVDLVRAYHRHGTEWGVIVPYKKQAAHIRRELRRQGAWSASELQERVATVDSFQGKECDLIIFGFTRSNPHGRVGFLVELRRLNVSLTRAKRQLIVVGDTQMLTQARDVDLANLMQALVATVKALPGGYLDVSELRRKLT